MAIYAENVVKQAQAWLGCKESDGSHKKIIDLYNTYLPRPRGYKVKYTDAWCATFVSAVALACHATDVIPMECSCSKMIELFKKLGTWEEKDNVVPTSGMIIFYDWEDSGVGDNRGASDHVGIVEAVKGNEITVIEGNYNNAVGRRKLKVDGKYIRGYGVPKYAKNIISFKVGDKVKLASDAIYYNGKSIPSWVKKSTLYVREINGDRIVISTLKDGAITGAVNKKYLKLL